MLSNAYKAFLANFISLCVAGLVGNQGETWGSVHTVSFRHLIYRCSCCLAARRLLLKAFDLHLSQLFKVAGVNSLPCESKWEPEGDRKPQVITAAFLRTISGQMVYVEHMPEESSKEVYSCLSGES